LAFWQQRQWTFALPPEGVVTIGRAPDNQVCIDHESVSRYHATLTFGPQLQLQDLNAANGTYLQGRVSESGQTATLTSLARQRATVAVGQPITLGSVTAVVRHARGSVVPAPHLHALDIDEVRSPKLRDVYAQALKAAVANITVLMCGETGVGKELLARAIHHTSRRAAGRFLAINCGALSETLLEAELFGCEKGAYTGATHSRAGLIEAANGGTVLLDEVGELPPDTQVKLLRILEEGAVLRVGSRSPRPIDVRFLAATNRDLPAEVEAGNFRRDLYFRINGMTLTLPPLRERTVDIEGLARRFVRGSCAQLGRTEGLDISEQALELMRAYRWPGNVRELRNAMDRAVVLCSSHSVGVEHLPESMRMAEPLVASRVSEPMQAPVSAGAQVVEVDAQKFQAKLKALERLRIVEALKRSAGNQTRAAELLGISRRTLAARLTELDLPRPRKRNTGSEV
jgi:transcriptional regulator with PAS, ATPase and Fis domain